MKNISLFKFKDAIGSILYYQVVSKFILYGFVNGLVFFSNYIIEQTSDTICIRLESLIPFYILMILSFLILSFYTLLDINGMIILSKSLVENDKKTIVEIGKESFMILKSLFHKSGILFIVLSIFLSHFYICFYSHSLLKHLYLSNYNFTFFNRGPYLYILFFLILVLFVIILFHYSLVLPVMILKKKDVSDACSYSKKNIKFQYKRIIVLLLKYILIMFLTFVVFGCIPFVCMYLFLSNSDYLQIILTFVYFIDITFIILMKALCPIFFTMDIVRTIEEKEPSLPSIDFGKIVSIGWISFVLLSIFITSSHTFDVFFPVSEDTKIIAHKAGGRYANENTVEGLKASIQHNVNGAELDVQRTKDGYYIVQHDETFERLCGLKKTSSELTLEECKNLTVKDMYHTTSSPLATLDEMLDCAKGKIHLFIELKGATADSKMAEDLYQMVVDKDMVKEVTFTSLNYTLISELETNHPEVDTGYICYIVVGNLEDMPCDKVIVENSMATSEMISQIHNADKEVYIWTVDTYSGLKDRFLEPVDGVITDEVDMALQIKNQVDSKNPMNRVLNKIDEWW